MPAVSFLNAQTYDRPILRTKIEQLLEPLGGMKAFVKPGDRILLKPNLLTGSYPERECITRPELVAVVAELVMEAGGKPFLGDSPAFGTAWGVARNNGYLPWLEELNLPVVEFTGDRYAIDADNFGHLRLSKEAMQADGVINLPKLKSHCQLTMTMGVKNLFGCVPGKMKAWWHLEAGKDVNRFGEMLVQTARAIAPNLTILDGIIAHQGNGPSGGTPRSLGILGASADVFALDYACLMLLNVNPDWVPTIVAAQQLGYNPNLNSLTYPLLTPTDLQVSDWQLPDALLPIDFGVPRILRSTFKHLYIRWIKEPMQTYTQQR
ncbi:MAG: DUF362 domain-containing protein [Spirulina sp. SIO3F2]|nr:DUF362 domain-containing protein [Spirulina sp. SIO3F2]